MLSPAAAHIARVKAEAKTRAGDKPVLVSSFQPAYDKILLAKFRTDKSSLKTIRSHTRRNEIKRGVLPDYQQWIDEMMQAETFSFNQSSMFVWLLIWHIDAGEYSNAFKMALFALDKGINAPENFSRTLPEAIAEQMADELNRRDIQPLYCADLEALADALKPYDLIDPIKSKLCKVRGLAYLESNPEQARLLLEQALTLNKRAGVKKELKLLESNQGEITHVALSQEKRGGDLKNYTISAREAARRLGVTTPTVIRWARAAPNKLPHLMIPSGNRNLYRFNPQDIDAFKQSHLVKTS